MRRSLPLFVALCAALSSAGSALAAPPNLDEAPPFAQKLRHVPVGAWATYRTAYFGGNAPHDVRLALVARTPRQTVWEVSMPGPDGSILVEVTANHERGGPGAIVQHLVRVGTQAPMYLPLPADRKLASFRLLDSAARSGRQVVTVPAGEFAVRHGTRRLDAGGAARGYDFWVSQRVLPTGVVKFEEWTRGGNGVRLVQRTWELVQSGRGAKRTLDGKARPYDAVLFRQMFKP